ncbi:MAG: MATE family efflux transporter [Duncaniella sp.]|nr:MATE family efflux transporter [Duncaniella sp.]
MTHSLSRYRREYTDLIRLGLPVIITNMGIVMVAFADTLMVGRYGTRELGAAAFVNSIFILATVMLVGLAGGITPLVGRLYGRRDNHGVGAYMRAGVRVNIAVSLLFTAILGGLYFFLDRLGQPDELLPLVRPYYLVMLATLVPSALFNALQQTSNGCTDTSTPMWIIVGANSLNVLGNWLLIGGELGFPRLGLLGAGISTLTARIVGALAMMAVYRFSARRREFVEGWRIARSDGKRREVEREVWLTSYPVMLQSGIECFLWSFGGVVCGWFGTIQLASFQVVNTISQLAFMTYIGMGVAISVRVANFAGTSNFEAMRRISSAGLHINLVLATIFSCVYYLSFRTLVHFFTPDEAVIIGALPLVFPLILYQYCDSIQLTFANALRGTSVVRPLLWVALGSYLCVGVPSMLLLAVGCDLGNAGVYYSFNIALLVAAVAFSIFFRRTLSRMAAGMPKH